MAPPPGAQALRAGPQTYTPGARRPPAARALRPWRQPTTPADRRSPALEPIDLPPAIEQGVDMIYIDEELVPRAVQDNRLRVDPP